MTGEQVSIDKTCKTQVLNRERRLKSVDDYTSMYGSWQPATATVTAGSSSSELIALFLAVIQAASVLFNNTFCCECQHLVEFGLLNDECLL